MAWNEQKPDESDLLREIAGVIRSQKSEFRAGIEQHFYWDESSGASAGELRYSADTPGPPGAARAFFSPLSQVSAAPGGKLHLASNTSRLYAYTSSSSVVVASRYAIVADGASAATIPSAQKMLVLSGASLGISGNVTTAFSFPLFSYEVAPAVQLSSTASVSGNTVIWSIPQLVAVNASGFSVYVNSFGAVSTHTVMWRSVGTRRIGEDIV